MIDRRGVTKGGLALLGASILSPRPSWAQAAEAVPAHALAMYDDVKYPADFTHFDYVNPDAPRGGSIVLPAVGTSFDTLNPFVLRGTPAAGVTMIYETLTEPSLDEPFTQYGLLAETIATPKDRSFVEYRLREAARWHDGRPVTVDDVIFSFQILTTQGTPFFRAYYANVAKVEATGERTVRFTFDGASNRELPLIVGQLSILPKHWWEGRDFQAPSLDLPLGSGPYQVARAEPGRSIAYDRVEDWWAADVPAMRGRYNFDAIRYDYYRDLNVAFEAFKAGAYDWHIESSAMKWATGYTGPAVERGLIVKEEVVRDRGGSMQGYWFNLRRDQFKDPRVRQAIGYAFDFEWSNKTLFYGQYTRSDSYFAGSTTLASHGLPEGAELALLEPFRDQLPKEVFEQEFKLPVTDGSGNNRDQLRQAIALFKAAGWEVRDRKLTELATGKPMRFEILLDSPLFERITSPFVKNLERLGIEATIRTIDAAQYENRTKQFDFDMVVEIVGQSLSPGNEQREFWGSKAAGEPGSRNLPGIASPVVDAMIDKVIRAQTRDELETACRALDRVLLWGFYVVPHWYGKSDRLARWDKFGRPPAFPKYGIDQFAWWIDPAKAAQLEQARAALR